MTSEPTTSPPRLDGLRLRRSSTAEQAADAVRGLILRGDVQAGSPLRETELAAALGISRNTMREALRTLAREGLVVQDLHRVAIVATLTLEDVADVFTVRRLLELGSHELVALRDGTPDLARMRESVEAMRHVDRGDWQSIMDADRSFHEELVALAGSPRLSAAYRQLEGGIRRCLAVTTRSHRDPRELHEQHRRLLEHLAAGSHDAFREALGRQLADAEANIARVLRGHEAPPSTPSSEPATA